MSLRSPPEFQPRDAFAAAERSRAAADALDWSYDEAFSRNHGLLTLADQEKLRNSHVAIAGMGGVGGVHLMTLARLGIGKFTIADPDTFEVANFNRQFGARLGTVGQSKVAVMAEEARQINPELEIRMFNGRITEQNATEFLAGADVLIDGIDFFAIEARRLLFMTARQLGMWGVTAGPIGFSTAWLSFDPRGMSFDQYFDIQDGMDPFQQLIAFGVGLAPAATHMAYIDLSRVDLRAATGPSVSAACQLCSGVAAMEVVKILTGRGRVEAAPRYHQFDAFTGQLRRGRLAWGNRHPWQRVKRWYLARRFAEKPTHGDRLDRDRYSPVAPALDTIRADLATCETIRIE
jgi:molybdopterin/thiamine biosynthesis adenylyltransferase